VVILPEGLHEVVVCPVVAVFLLTEGEQFVQISVSVIQGDMSLPAISTETVAAGIGQKLALCQANRTLSLFPFWCEIVLAIFDDIPAGAVSIDEIVEVVGVEIGEEVEHEGPSVWHAAPEGFPLDLLPDFPDELVEVVDAVGFVLGTGGKEFAEAVVDVVLPDLLLGVLLLFVDLLLLLFDRGLLLHGDTIVLYLF